MHQCSWAAGPTPRWNHHGWMDTHYMHSLCMSICYSHLFIHNGKKFITFHCEGDVEDRKICTPCSLRSCSPPNIKKPWLVFQQGKYPFSLQPYSHAGNNFHTSNPISKFVCRNNGSLWWLGASWTPKRRCLRRCTNQHWPHEALPRFNTKPEP